MSADGHGIPDSAAQAAHQVIGHADQTQHQEELERRRSGLNDQALDNERTFIKGAERRASVSVVSYKPSVTSFVLTTDDSTEKEVVSGTRSRKQSTNLWAS
jgi:hypothetical protein